jgi:hypothetical protein
LKLQLSLKNMELNVGIRTIYHPRSVCKKMTLGLYYQSGPQGNLQSE